MSALHEFSVRYVTQRAEASILRGNYPIHVKIYWCFSNKKEEE